MTALIGGGVLGALRLLLEILSKKGLFSFGPLQWFADMNYLHFAIFLFAVSIILMLVMSFFGEPPKEEQIRNMTITGNGKSKSIKEKIAAEDSHWNHLNIGFSVVLVLTILSLWGIFF